MTRGGNIPSKRNKPCLKFPFQDHFGVEILGFDADFDPGVARLASYPRILSSPFFLKTTPRVVITLKITTHAGVQ